jgi:hypothetical protein
MGRWLRELGAAPVVALCAWAPTSESGTLCHGDGAHGRGDHAAGGC